MPFEFSDPAELHPLLPKWLALLHQEHRPGAAFVAQRFRHDLAALPGRWRERIVGTTMRRILQAPHQGEERNAWVAYDALLERIAAGVPGVPLDADDDLIREKADRLAADAYRICRDHQDDIDAGQIPRELGAWLRLQRQDLPAGRRACHKTARACCPHWWRRQLRRSHARAMEGSAIALGLVHKAGQAYVSDQSLGRRQAQLARNAAILRDTTATNEWAQEYSLAELANKSTAAKDIRRHELIVRLKGFEKWAARARDDALFVTITCPSRFHSHDFRGQPNPNADPALTPADGQAYLRRVWARIRAHLAHAGVRVYGVRIAEPHGDGTPHWHFVLFFPRKAPQRAASERQWHWPTSPRVTVDAAFRRYGMADSPLEAGAAEHRLRFIPIDKEKGSAVGYALKYVSKNVDGFQLGQWWIDGDLAGDGELNLSPRVEAWAATWGIRQFQQIGGAPVGLWREFRRVRLVSPDRAAHLSDAFISGFFACNRWLESRSANEHGEMIEKHPADYCEFWEAVRASRGRLALQRDAAFRLNRYGEIAPRPIVGIRDHARAWRDYHGIVGEQQISLGLANVPSLRFKWTLVHHRGANAHHHHSRRVDEHQSLALRSLRPDARWEHRALLHRRRPPARPVQLPPQSAVRIMLGRTASCRRPLFGATPGYREGWPSARFAPDPSASDRIGDFDRTVAVQSAAVVFPGA